MEADGDATMDKQRLVLGDECNGVVGDNAPGNIAIIISYTQLRFNVFDKTVHYSVLHVKEL